MKVKKRKPARRMPDLTFDIDRPLQVFTDKPRAGARRTSPGVVTSYDPAVNELAERLRREAACRKESEAASNGQTKVGTGKTDRQRLKVLELHLDDCLSLAKAVNSKQTAKIVQMLRDARSQVQKLRG